MPEYARRRRYDSDRLVRISREENILLQNNGARTQIVHATLNRSYFCDHGKVVEMITNLKPLTESHVANYLLAVGNGKNSVEQSLDRDVVTLIQEKTPRDKSMTALISTLLQVFSLTSKESAVLDILESTIKGGAVLWPDSNDHCSAIFVDVGIRDSVVIVVLSVIVIVLSVLMLRLLLLIT
ncbi:Hypothetical predicted protein [Octopus vulgaris]|uniref:Uncharacterized protein n=1 Tax=Octopus vulgaris TaxID=6645 RepID=A0AA36AP20_OCTVU|nr:Hypothetical predicted protein [Octopus vulgaris]